MFVDYAAGGFAVKGGNVVNVRPGGGPGVMESILDSGGTRIQWDPGLRQPYLDKNGDLAVTVRTGRWTTNKGVKVPIKEHRLIRDLVNNGTIAPADVMVTNATALRKEEWIQYDQQVKLAYRLRLRAWADLQKSSSYGGFSGMARMELEHEVMTDPGEALVDMDGLTEGRSDAPKYQLRGLPLTITHSDFWISSRKLAISRNSGSPIDTRMGEEAGRRIGENLERTTIGVQTGVTYGGQMTQFGGYDITSAVFGYTNYPNRLVKTGGYIPTGNGRSGTGWVPLDTVKDVLAALITLRQNRMYGPFVIYHSDDWDQYLDSDYILTGGNVATQTLRARLGAIGRQQGDDTDGYATQINGVKRLDFLFSSLTDPSHGGAGHEASNVNNAYPFTFLIVMQDPNVARAVNGMDITTVQWEVKGGMELHFKVMCIQVPQLFSDIYGNCGILQFTFNT
jgi:hypothetical protein